MKPANIFNILDLARAVVNNGKKYNPMFIGPPGIGKSEIVQAWCKKNGLPFIDVRAAYYEAPDLKGFPVTEKEDDGTIVQKMAAPNFWPRDPEWEGVIFLDEVNRGANSVMNCFMQMLTDNRIEELQLPRKTMIVACINPETTDYEVSTMDPAFRNRFSIFNVDYDKKSFVQYMREASYDPTLVLFVESDTWKYLAPEDVGSNAGSKYVSPRDINFLNNVLKVGVDKSVEMDVYTSILGKNVAKTFFQFKNEEQPVLYTDLVRDRKRALKKLKEYSNPENLKNGHLSITVDTILDDSTIEDDLLYDVLMTLPADMGPALLRDLEHKRKDKNLTSKMFNSYKDLAKRLYTMKVGK